MAGNRESTPNDPVLFAELHRTLAAYHSEHGEAFSMLCREDFGTHWADSMHFLNNYPNEPRELYGVIGVLNERDIDRNGIRHDPRSTLIEAGTRACGIATASDGLERAVQSWLFNRQQREKYQRIGEMAIRYAVANTLPDVYWLESDGSVRSCYFEDDDTARRQLIDHELEEVVDIVRNTESY